jgi:HK97 family phage portal protein
MPLKSLLSSETKLVTRDVIPARTGALTTMVNGRLVTYDDNKETYFTKAYNVNDTVYSIINLITDKIRVAPWGVYRVVDEKSYKQYKAILKKKDWSAKDHSRAVKLQGKALEMLEDGGALGQLLDNPNDTDTFSDLVANAAGFKLLTGDAYLWANRLTLGSDKGLPGELVLLPSQYVEIYSTDTFPSRVTGYRLSYLRDKENKYAPEDVMHTKYWNPDYQINGANHYGVAPLKAALNLLQRSNSSMTASASLYKNEGIKGMLTLDHKVSEGASDEALDEVNRLAQAMRTSWTGETNRGKIGLGGYSMQWIPIGLSQQDMQIIESEKWDLRRLCNVFGLSSELLNDPDNKTYANKEEAEAALTTRAALPQMTSFRDNFNKKLIKDWGGKPGIVIDFDLTCYTELQTDAKDTVTWGVQLMDRGWPLNRLLDVLQLEKMDDPIFDEGRVTPQMGQTLTDYNLNEVDSALNEENENSGNL